MLASFEGLRLSHDVGGVAAGGTTVRDTGKDVAPRAEAVDLFCEVLRNWGEERHESEVKGNRNKDNPANLSACQDAAP